VYFWIPKWTGVMYSERLGQWHFWCSLISVNMLFFPMHFVGLAGMPRRIPDYALQFADMNAFISIGGALFGLSQLLFVWGVVRCMRRKGEKASTQVWEGAHGLEWEIPSPAPYHTFQTPPTVK
jgi:cytochrome c oxidase subunit 1